MLHPRQVLKVKIFLEWANSKYEKLLKGFEVFKLNISGIISHCLQILTQLIVFCQEWCLQVTCRTASTLDKLKEGCLLTISKHILKE